MRPARNRANFVTRQGEFSGHVAANSSSAENADSHANPPSLGRIWPSVFCDYLEYFGDNLLIFGIMAHGQVRRDARVCEDCGSREPIGGRSPIGIAPHLRQPATHGAWGNARNNTRRADNAPPLLER